MKPVASTIGSVEGYLPVHYDTDSNSLYTWLTAKGVPVKMNLVGMFHGARISSTIADTAQPAWMTNASVYCQYKSTLEKYENSEPPVPQTFGPNVRYFTFFNGDYDSSAWLKLLVPICFTQESRGEFPMMWAFNPNLSDRVPNKFDMDIVGSIINGISLTQREFKIYAEMGIKGSFYGNYDEHIVVYNDTTPFLKMYDAHPGAHEWLEGMYDVINGSGTNFASFRTIRLYTDQIVDAIKEFEDYASAKNDGYTYKYVDMYTIFDLILQSGQGELLYDE